MFKVIPGNTVPQPSRWVMPKVAGVPIGHGRRRVGTGSTAEEMQALKQAAREEGFAQGYAEGMAAATTELKDKCEHLDGIVTSLTKPVAELDQELERELTELSIAIAKQVIRRELKIDPTQVIAVVRAAKNALPASAREIVIVLHPEDAKILRDVWLQENEPPTWQLQEDPAITRGGCKILSQTSVIDATIEGQVAKLSASLLGGQRRNDANPGVAGAGDSSAADGVAGQSGGHAPSVVRSADE